MTTFPITMIVQSGNLDASRYPDVARKVVELFPNISKVAITLRESLSATHNSWGAMLLDAGVSLAWWLLNPFPFDEL